VPGRTAAGTLPTKECDGAANTTNRSVPVESAGDVIATKRHHMGRHRPETVHEDVQYDALASPQARGPLSSSAKTKRAQRFGEFIYLKS
jgi:hypothetical protein